MREPQQHTPEGAADFHPQKTERPKTPKLGRFKRALAVGAGLLGLEAGSQAAMAQQGKLDKAMNVVRTGGDILSAQRQIQTERERIRKEAAIRAAEIAAQERMQQRQEMTQRQRAAMGTSAQAGWEGMKAKADDTATTLEVTKPGSTPYERMDLNRQVHEEAMAEKQQEQNMLDIIAVKQKNRIKLSAAEEQWFQSYIQKQMQKGLTEK
jgi:hypothetical protein